MRQTVEYWLKWVEQQFLAADLYYGHGTDNAWDEAVQLVLQALNLPINSGSEVLNKPVTDGEAEAIESLARRRIESRLPLPYLLNQAWFAGLPFYVDQRVLIPRSPFAELIQAHFQPWIKEPSTVRHILEIGTGSGCMAILAALEFENALVDAVDISVDALEVAKRNVADYKLQKRVHLLESDCFSNVPKQHYDIIISNPPYVSAAEMQILPAEYLHEPEQALLAANEGLVIVDRILQQAADYLTETGILVVEVGNSEAALVKRYPQVPFVWLEMEFGGHGLFLLTAKDLQPIMNANEMKES